MTTDDYLLSSGSGAIVLGLTALLVQRGVEPGEAYDRAIDRFEEHMRVDGTDSWVPSELRRLVVELASG